MTSRPLRRRDSKQGYQALTPRELDVLRLLALGITKPETARMLGLSYSTVRSHSEHIANKLGISRTCKGGAGEGNRHLMAYVATGLKHGLISIEQLLEMGVD